MKQQVDLLKDDVRGLFFKYLIPSISATLVTSIYVLADTIIIGKGIGADAVAALNLVLPLFTLFFGTGLLFGVGGSILMSIHKASQNVKAANGYFTTALFANLFMVIFYLTLGFCFFEPIAYALGSTKETIGLVREYGEMLVLGIPFFLFSTFLQAFIRNDKAPKLCMVAVVSGGVLNIILDYIFVYHIHMGMKGAALATVIGAITTCSILVMHFFSKSNTLRIHITSISLVYLVDIIKNGLASFLIEMASGIVTFFFNLQLLNYIGVIGVSVYSIISNTAIIVMSLGNGISQAAQPILSMNYGAGQKDRIQIVRRLGIMVASIVGGAFVLLGFLIPDAIVHIFVHPTSEMMELAPTAIRIYFVSFIGCTLNMFFINYCQATVKPLQSLTICLLRGLILSVALVYLLPALFGYQGIWFVMPVTEFLTFIIALLLLKKKTT